MNPLMRFLFAALLLAVVDAGVQVRLYQADQDDSLSRG